MHTISPVQIMCVLINIASASEKTRDTMAERDDILNVVATTLVRCHMSYHNAIISYILNEVLRKTNEIP